MTHAVFSHARPVWGNDLSRKKNITLSFSAEKPAGKGWLKLSAFAVWQVFLGDTMIAAGPARAGHGFYRVDEIPLPTDSGTLVIRIAGYNTPSYWMPDLPPFCCAELYGPDGSLLAATGAENIPGFTAVRYTARVQDVPKYTFQRSFIEAYRIGLSEDIPVDVVPVEDKVFIERDVPYPEYDRLPAAAVVSRGTFTRGSMVNVSEDGIDYAMHPRAEADACVFEDGEAMDAPAEELVLRAGEFICITMGREVTGFIGFEVTVPAGGRLLVSFSELLYSDIPAFNTIAYELAPGTHRILTAEPYALQRIRFAADADMTIRHTHMILYEYPSAPLLPKPEIRDKVLAGIYDAAVCTFRQNTVDVYMDCPGRERAGWLCDSFFTARTEFALTGRSVVERAFLENFLMPESFEHLPDGMLPMCYPADHPNENFIPNWAMWYALELEEYLARSGDRALIDRAKARMYALLGYFRRFENGFGLLEKLEKWVFLEWSRCNDLTQDINYPTNMLYARFKDALAHLYGDDTLAAEADALRAEIRRQSFTGTFFCDNAVYRDGEAVLSGECTETCQYYAFFSGTATRESYPELWSLLVRDFGPYRDTKAVYPAVAESNAFIGDYLRLELLFNAGEYDAVLRDIHGYFRVMAESTGTLWEHNRSGINGNGSCNHGFASHVAVWLRKLAERGL